MTISDRSASTREWNEAEREVCVSGARAVALLVSLLEARALPASVTATAIEIVVDFDAGLRRARAVVERELAR